MRALPRPRPGSACLRRRVAAGACALATAALAGGCGFVNALAHPDTPSDVASETAAAVGRTASETPQAAVVSAAADLVGSLDGRAASLAVAVAPVRKGVPPVQTLGGLLSQDCRLAPDTTEYATVSVVFTGRWKPTKQTGVSTNLRVDLTLAGGPGLGLLAVDPISTDYCDDTSTLPSQAVLQSVNLADEHQTMTVYVVGRTGPTDPDPLHGVTLRLRDPRHHPDDIDSRKWAWSVQRVTAGSACTGDVNSLCVPLG